MKLKIKLSIIVIAIMAVIVSGIAMILLMEASKIRSFALCLTAVIVIL